MRLTSFSVKGFKNFREEVTLEGLSAINILHGENNVGKSNLMEALLLALELWDVGLEPEGFSTPDQKLLAKLVHSSTRGGARSLAGDRGWWPRVQIAGASADLEGFGPAHFHPA